MLVAIPSVAATTGTTATSTPEIVIPAVEKELTFDEKFSLLAVKYGVKESSARAIIGCESKWKPDAVGLNWKYKKKLDELGNVVLGINGKPLLVKDYVWSKDIGYWQINTFYHQKDMAAKGWDIYDPEDNLEAGFYLFSKQGAKPWAWSAHCHHQY